MQYVPPEGSFYIDILTRLGEAYRYEDLVAQRVDFEGLAVNVATPETLYKLKDWGDAAALQRRFKLEAK